MFGSRKIISGKYAIFRKCYFPERKTFSCVWLSQNSFYGKLILVFGSFNQFTRKYIKSGETLVRRAALVDRRARSSIDDRNRRTIALVDRRETSALVDRDRRSRRSIDDRDRAPRRSSARCDRRTSGAARSGLSLSDLGSLFSLSLSLSFSGSQLK